MKQTAFIVSFILLMASGPMSLVMACCQNNPKIQSEAVPSCHAPATQSTKEENSLYNFDLELDQKHFSMNCDFCCGTPIPLNQTTYKFETINDSVNEFYSYKPKNYEYVLFRPPIS